MRYSMARIVLSTWWSPAGPQSGGEEELSGCPTEMWRDVTDWKRKQILAGHANEANLKIVRSGMKSENLSESRSAAAWGRASNSPEVCSLSQVCQALGVLPSTYRANCIRLQITSNYTDLFLQIDKLKYNLSEPSIPDNPKEYSFLLLSAQLYARRLSLSC